MFSMVDDAGGDVRQKTECMLLASSINLLRRTVSLCVFQTNAAIPPRLIQHKQQKHHRVASKHSPEINSRPTIICSATVTFCPKEV